MDLYANGPLLMYWTHSLKAPWQTESWRQQMARQLRRNQYLRMIENRWVSTESEFIDLAWWDRSATGTPVAADSGLAVVLGVDAAVKRDSAAVVACGFEREVKKVRLAAHRIFNPRPTNR